MFTYNKQLNLTMTSFTVSILVLLFITYQELKRYCNWKLNLPVGILVDWGGISHGDFKGYVYQIWFRTLSRRVIYHPFLPRGSIQNPTIQKVSSFLVSERTSYQMQDYSITCLLPSYHSPYVIAALFMDNIVLVGFALYVFGYIA